MSRTRLRQDNPRLAALDLLSGVLDAKQSLADSEAPRRMAHGRDAAFAMHLAYEVLRWLGALEWLSAQLLDKPLKHRDRDIARLILLGLAQLWRDEAASHAAVNETAECARLVRKPWAVGLVNAILRRFQREKQGMLQSLEQADARYAHPAWLLDAIRSDWPDHWQDALAANNEHPPMWLRLNRQRVDGAAFQKDMEAAGFETTVHVDNDLVPIKESVGLPYGLGSCHTAKIQGYFIEGHVPAADVKRLLAERPDARGLTVPGMPLGSPGMEVPSGRQDAYEVLLVLPDGSTEVFARHGSP